MSREEGGLFMFKLILNGYRESSTAIYVRTVLTDQDHRGALTVQVVDWWHARGSPPSPRG